MSTPGSRFYLVNDRPVAVVPTRDGGADCLAFDFVTGELLPNRSYFEYLTPGSRRDVDVLTETEFAARLAVYRAEAGAPAKTGCHPRVRVPVPCSAGPLEMAIAGVAWVRNNVIWR
jgi:hypothetical protein